MDIHRAARICAAAHGGQILLADAVAVLASKDLPDGVSLRDASSAFRSVALKHGSVSRVSKMDVGWST
jgi:class 3 adenylate cyclase